MGGPRFRLLGLIVAVALTASTAGCTASSKSAGAASHVVTVVAAENSWGDIVRQIGGSHVSVTVIISDPNIDPHEYESDARAAAALADAQLVIKNGLGYDDFIDKLLRASPNPDRTVLSAAGIIQAGVANPNPHLWYDTAELPRVAAAIAAQLAKREPAEAATFAANEKAFTASLQPILTVIATIKARYPGAPIAYTERVPGYLVDAAGLSLATPASFAQSIENGSDPSVADEAAFTAAITGRKVKLLLYNGQVTNPATVKLKTLARQNGIPVVGVSETIPAGDKNFQAWQLRQAAEILQALGS